MMRITRRLVVSLIACALAFSYAAPPALAATKNVSIVSYSFTPSSVSIHVGDTVIWTNNDPPTTFYDHTATSDDGHSFSSGMLAPGHSYSFTFTKAGTFTYHCDVHPYMTASVTVIGATSTPSPKPSKTPTSRPTPTATATAKPTVVPVSPTPTSSVKPSPRASKSAVPPTPASPPASPSRVVAAGSSSSGAGVALPVIAGLLIVLVAIGAFALRARRAHR